MVVPFCGANSKLKGVKLRAIKNSNNFRLHRNAGVTNRWNALIIGTTLKGNLKIMCVGIGHLHFLRSHWFEINLWAGHNFSDCRVCAKTKCHFTWPGTSNNSHRGICLSNHFIPYFCAPGVKHGVKRSEKLQGTGIFRFVLLFFSQNWTNFEKPPQNGGFWLSFGRFWRFFNSDSKTAAQT